MSLVLSVALLGSIVVGTIGTPHTALAARDATIRYTPTSGEAIDVVKNTHLIGPGELTLGRFGIVRLAADTRLTVTTIARDDASASVCEAVLTFERGHVWAANFLAGSHIAITDGTTTATTLGGAFIFENTNDGAKGMHLITTTRGVTYLTSGTTTTLTSDTKAATYLAADDTIRIDGAGKKTHIHRTDDQFVQNNIARDTFYLTTLTQQMMTSLAEREPDILIAARSAVAVLPSAKERTETLHASAMLGKIIAGEDAVTTPLDGAQLAAMTPYFALVPTERITDGTAGAITRLAALGRDVGTTDTRDAFPSLRAYRTFVAAATGKPATRIALINSASIATSADDPYVTLALEALTHTIATAIQKNESTVAIIGVQKLAKMLEKANSLSDATIEDFSRRGLDFKTQLEYLATLPVGSAFDTNDYLAWQLAGHFAPADATNEVTPSATETTTSTDGIPSTPHKIARPKASFDRFLEVVKEEKKDAPVTTTSTTPSSDVKPATTTTINATALGSDLLGTTTPFRHRHHVK